MAWKTFYITEEHSTKQYCNEVTLEAIILYLRFIEENNIVEFVLYEKFVMD